MGWLHEMVSRMISEADAKMGRIICFDAQIWRASERVNTVLLQVLFKDGSLISVGKCGDLARPRWAEIG
jgi:hypothetical protein